MPSIHFHSEEVDFDLKNEQETGDWIANIIESEGFSLEELNFIFCSDAYLHEINIQYLNHDTFTDIITFDQSEAKDIIEGDIFISIERVQANASSLQVSFDDEISRVIIHGVLHLMGHSDQTPEEKQAMRKKEEACLSLRA